MAGITREAKKGHSEVNCVHQTLSTGSTKDVTNYTLEKLTICQRVMDSAPILSPDPTYSFSLPCCLQRFSIRQELKMVLSALPITAQWAMA